MERKRLRGRIKTFWLFLLIFSIMALVSNLAVQFFMKGEIDFYYSLSTSFTIGIVIAIVMSTKKISRMINGGNNDEKTE